jgi:hypothetical protein
MRGSSFRARCASATVISFAAAFAVVGCARDDAPEEAEPRAAIGERFPDAIGVFHAVGDVRPGVAEAFGRRLVSAERAYDDAGREATLRIVDVTSERSLVTAFALARDITIDELDALTRPGHVAHQPAVVQWTRDTGESEVQVLVSERYLVTLKIWPADRRDEARDFFPESVVEALARAR